MSLTNVMSDDRTAKTGPLPPSPPANRSVINSRWRQPRFLWGLGLIFVSVLLGALFVGATDERTSVWTVSRDLSPGTQLTADDLIAVSVEVDRVDRYVRADSSAVVGRRLATAVLAGELLPVSAVAGNPASGRLVTIPVEPLHAPTDLAHGNRVDVYVSPRDAVSAGVSRLVVSNALVADVAADLDSPSGEIAVILQVDPAQTPALISASRGGVIDLVAVPPGAPS